MTSPSSCALVLAKLIALFGISTCAAEDEHARREASKRGVIDKRPELVAYRAALQPILESTEVEALLRTEWSTDETVLQCQFAAASSAFWLPMHAAGVVNANGHTFDLATSMLDDPSRRPELLAEWCERATGYLSLDCAASPEPEEIHGWNIVCSPSRSGEPSRDDRVGALMGVTNRCDDALALAERCARGEAATIESANQASRVWTTVLHSFHWRGYGSSYGVDSEPGLVRGDDSAPSVEPVQWNLASARPRILAARTG